MDAVAIAALARSFGIDADEARPLEGGYVNEVWLTAPQASVVRRYGRLHVARRSVQFEHDVQEHAAAKLRLVCAPLHDDSGATIRLADGRFAAVFPFVAGTGGDRSLAASRACMEVLAAYHRAMVDFHPGKGARAVRSLGILPWLRERVMRLAADRRLARRIAWDDVLKGCADATIGIAPVATLLPIIVVHGDPHPDNFITQSQVPKGLIDFDFAHESERVYDVASAIDEFAREGNDAPLALDRARALASAYHACAPLSEQEWQVIPDMMIRRNAALVWHVVSAHSARAPGEVGNAERYVKRINEIVGLARALRTLTPAEATGAA